jgi:hypothetical protein
VEETLGNVTVEMGAYCTLMGVIVEGNVTAVGADDIDFKEITVSGNIAIKQSEGIVDIDGAWVGGNISVLQSNTTFIQVANAQVGGNVLVMGNYVPGSLFVGEGLLIVRPNEIDGNLIVAGNDVGSLVQVGSCVSGGNNVQGKISMSNNSAGIGAAVNCNEVAGSIAVKGNEVIGGSVFAPDEDVQVTGNTVGGDVSVRNNKSTYQIAVGDALAEQGQPDLFKNIIGGNLLCSGNDPDPTTESTDPDDSSPVAEGNIVEGRLDCAD